MIFFLFFFFFFNYLPKIFSLFWNKERCIYIIVAINNLNYKMGDQGFLFIFFFFFFFFLEE